MRMRVIGLGQAAAGDDAAGLAVLRALRAQAIASDVELLTLAEPSALVPLLEDGTPLILVDAVCEDPPGEVLELSAEELAARPSPLSSHGLGVVEVIGLARALAGGRALPPLRVVAITISLPSRYAQGLSRDVARAVPRAVTHVLSLIDEGFA